jgi:hypothetical protein
VLNEAVVTDSIFLDALVELDAAADGAPPMELSEDPWLDEDDLFAQATPAPAVRADEPRARRTEGLRDALDDLPIRLQRALAATRRCARDNLTAIRRAPLHAPRRPRRIAVVASLGGVLAAIAAVVLPIGGSDRVRSPVAESPRTPSRPAGGIQPVAPKPAPVSPAPDASRPMHEQRQGNGASGHRRSRSQRAHDGRPRKRTVRPVGSSRHRPPAPAQPVVRSAPAHGATDEFGFER